MTDASQPVVDQIWGALRQIFDPCSLISEEPIDIVSLGLVTGVEFSDGGGVTIRLTTTDPMCFFFLDMASAATDAVSAIRGVEEVDVLYDDTVTWQPSDYRRLPVASFGEARSSCSRGQHG